MAKRRGRKPQSIPMKIGNDPALWRYASVQEALEANTHLLARLIQAGQNRHKRMGAKSKHRKQFPYRRVREIHV